MAVNLSRRFGLRHIHHDDECLAQSLSLRLKKPRGFTLIELLVVIGIIGVLISILLPALSAARSRAKITACASNIRQIIAATQIYAADSHGYLPQRQNAGYAHLSNNGVEFAFLTFGISGGRTVSCNIGALIDGGYLGNPLSASYLAATNAATGQPNYYNTAICPVRFDPAVDPSILAAALGSTSSAQAFVYSSSYLFNPHWAFTTSSLYPGETVSWYIRVADYSPYKALVTDMVLGTADSAGNGWQGVIPHPSSGRWTYNLGYIDGHVTSVADTILMQSSPFGSGSALGYAVRMPTGLEGFDSDLDVLETEEEGQSPLLWCAVPGQRPLYNKYGYNSSSPFEYRIQQNPAAVGLYHPQVNWP
jgi:prepilin-type N-terminal cleavage/methylation domain-containing protein